MRRLGIMEELELIWRRSRKIALALPVLLLVGFGTGNLTNRALEIPEGTEVYQPRDPRTRMRLEALGEAMERMRGEGNRTADYVRVYREHVQPVERVLVRRGMAEETARKIAWPLVEQTYRNQLDIATVLSVIYIESNGEPTATSSVGARGLMQVMPLWAGYWRACGHDLYEIEDNICNGTSILAYYMDRADGDERRALLGYNGCVRGTTTPRCHTYPDKVAGLRRQIARELTQNRARPVPRASMSATTAP